MKRNPIFILFILFLLSSCTGSPTTEPIETPTLEQLNAQNSINNAIEKYNNSLDNYSKLQQELSLAESRGVDVSNVANINKKISDILKNAQDDVNLANQYYQDERYTSASGIAENTIISLDELNPLLNQANDVLKSAYNATIEIYKKKIQEGKREIIIASAYIQDAKNSGASTDNLDSELSITSNLLENAESSFSNMDFYKIDEYLNGLKLKTDKIKEDALYSKRSHLTSLAIAEVKKIVKSDMGYEIINMAIAEKNKGNFQSAINLLNKAIVSNIFTEYKLKKVKIIDYCENQGIQLNTEPIDSMEDKIIAYMENEKYSEATKSIQEYKEPIEKAMNVCVDVYNAELALESLKEADYLGVKADISKTSDFYNNAVKELKRGKYSQATSYADGSLKEAQKERDNFYSQIENDAIKKILSKIFAVFGKGPPNIIFKTIEGIPLSWSSVPETLVNIDLSPPKVNIDTGKLEGISSPSISLPIYSTSQKSLKTPKTVDFSLSIPEPSYEFCCGLIPSKVNVWGTATIENTGSQPAHSVKVRFELLSSDGKRIKLSGEDYIEKYVGNLESGASKTEPIEFTIGISNGYGIQNNGAKAVYYIYSDEKDMKIEEEF